MLLLASFGLHQICSSFRDSTQPRNRGQHWLTNFSCENSRNSLEVSESVIACKPLDEESDHVGSVTDFGTQRASCSFARWDDDRNACFVCA
jgi:hypothetical protein